MKNAEPPIPVRRDCAEIGSLGSTASSPGGKGSVSTTSYFRSLATRCLTSARRCSDQFAKEKLANSLLSSKLKLLSWNGPTSVPRRVAGGPLGGSRLADSRVMPEHTLGRR